MKTVTLLLASTTLLMAMPTQADWNFIKLLKGAEERPMQRVAFVGAAIVRETSGEVERLSGIDRWTPVTRNERLRPGDIVRVADGSLTLRMEESESYARITPHTIVRLAPYNQKWDRAALTGTEERDGFAVRSCRGAAFCRDDSQGEWRPLKVNSVLPETAELRMREGTVVDLYSTVESQAYRLRQATAVRLSEISAPKAESSIAAVTR